MKQTTVEWLGLKLNMLFTDITEEQWNKAEKLFQQAKEMEKEEPKQETLEEAAKNESEYLADWEDKEMYQKGFIDGAKWQAKRSYSEEEVIEFGKFMLLGNHEYKSYTDIFNEWFEQFKKKK